MVMLPNIMTEQEGKGYSVIGTIKTFGYENTRMLRLLKKMRSNMHISIQHLLDKLYSKVY